MDCVTLALWNIFKSSKHFLYSFIPLQNLARKINMIFSFQTAGRTFLKWEFYSAIHWMFTLFTTVRYTKCIRHTHYYNVSKYCRMREMVKLTILCETTKFPNQYKNKVQLPGFAICIEYVQYIFHIHYRSSLSKTGEIKHVE